MGAQANVPDMNVSTALDADAARAAYGIDGTGLKIGILSDSFDNTGGADADEADGWLPTADAVNVLQDSANGQDEGRAMAEMIHAIAPGAEIDFYAPQGSLNNFAAGVAAMQADGCSVICDDTINYNEPFFQLGDAAEEAIKTFTKAGGVYFTLASNASGQSAREDTWSGMTADLPGVGTVQALNMGGSGTPSAYGSFTATSSHAIQIGMQWDQPWLSVDGTGSAYSLALAIYDSDGNLVANLDRDQTGGDAQQTGGFTPVKGETYTYAIYCNGGTPEDGDAVKEIFNNDGAGTVVAGSNTGATVGHDADPYAITVGAVNLRHAPNYDDDLSNEPFSSHGPTTLTRSSTGAAFGTPQVSRTVDVDGVDGQATSLPAGGLNPFYGTSAATPTVAAVGLLMKAANGALSTNEVRALMEGTADAFGTMQESGYGLVEARGALGMAVESNTLLRNDIYSDGKSAVVFTDKAGDAATWRVSGSHVREVDPLASPGAGWTYFASGDFEGGPGGASLLWTDGNGNVDVEHESYGQAGAIDLVQGPGVGWKAVATGDFNGDGASDILFQSADHQLEIYDMQGTTVESKEVIPARTKQGATFAGVGDFNLDGTTDVLFASRGGGLAVWEMSGDQVVARNTLDVKMTASQHVVGVGDLDGTGYSDILLQDRNTGALEVVRTDGQSVISATPVTGFDAARSLVVKGIGEVDASGHAGILLQDQQTGAVQTLTLNGDAVSTQNLLGNAGAGFSAQIR